MKQLIILCSLSMVLPFNLYAGHEPLRQRTKSEQGPSTSSMQKEGNNNKTRLSALKEECTDCCGGCLDVLTTPIDQLPDMALRTVGGYIIISH